MSCLPEVLPKHAKDKLPIWALPQLALPLPVCYDLLLSQSNLRNMFKHQDLSSQEKTLTEMPLSCKTTFSEAAKKWREHLLLAIRAEEGGGQEMGVAISKFDKLAAQLRVAKKLERGNKLKSDKHEPRERER